MQRTLTRTLTPNGLLRANCAVVAAGLGLIAPWLSWRTPYEGVHSSGLLTLRPVSPAPPPGSGWTTSPTDTAIAFVVGTTGRLAVVGVLVIACLAVRAGMAQVGLRSVLIALLTAFPIVTVAAWWAAGGRIGIGSVGSEPEARILALVPAGPLLVLAAVILAAGAWTRPTAPQR